MGQIASDVINLPKFTLRAYCLEGFPQILTLKAQDHMVGTGFLFLTTGPGMKPLPRSIEKWILSTIEKLPGVLNSDYPADRIIGYMNPLRKKLRYAWKGDMAKWRY